MEGRPPEVNDTATGRVEKLACMACIRGHRTKHCGAVNCRDKILWTIKRPGRPANSCMCGRGGTARCKCVLAKTQCPHKPTKKGEKKTVDCRCDERGRYCCTLSVAQWEMLAKGLRPAVRLYRTLEESIPDNMLSSDGLGYGANGHGSFSVPQTPSTPKEGYNNSHGSTPQTPSAALRSPDPMVSFLTRPITPAGPPRARFGMMGIGAPLGSEGHVGQDVLSWQGQVPAAPTPRPTYPMSPGYSHPLPHVPPPFPAILDPALSAPIHTFMPHVQHTPQYVPQHQEAIIHSHPASPFHQPPPPQYPSYATFDALPPVTASFNAMSVAPADTLPTLSSFDMDYFNFQLPSAICQNCSMADCTCRQCPTVLQNTMDGSWQQCCSRKHSHFGPPAAVVQGDAVVAKSCCGSKAAVPNGHATSHQGEQSSGCCAGASSTTATDDPFDFGMQSAPYTPFTAVASTPYTVGASAAPTPALLYDPGAPPPQTDDLYSTAHTESDRVFEQEIASAWNDVQDTSMDFDEFLQDLGCGCGPDCPCGMDDSLGLDDSLEMDIDVDPGGGGVANGGSSAATGNVPSRGCCGGQ